jgi:hypothetical protein
VPAAQLGLLHALAMGMTLEELKKTVNEDEALVNLIFFNFLSVPATP